jgi:hypothetical protein
MKKCLVLLIAIALIAVGLSFGSDEGSTNSQSIPHLINYQGVLTSPGGDPVQDGTYEIYFGIYDAAQGGNLEWDHAYSVTVTNGLFTVLLGESEPIDLPFDEDYWLEIKVDNDPPLSPRIRITSVGYAYRAEVANTAVVAGSGGGWVDDGSVVRLENTSDRVGIGLTSPEALLHLVGGVWDVTNTEGDFKIGDSSYRLKIGVARGGFGAGDVRIRAEGGTNNLMLGAGTDDVLFIKGNGSVGIGTSSPSRRLTVRGNILVESETGAAILELGEGLDYAEGFDVSDHLDITPGAVMIIDPSNPGKLAMSSKPYDSKVAGIVAGANEMGSGVRLGADQFDYDVALAGRVYCNVDATETTVKPGDLLTTSSTPGHAMKATDYLRAQGAILGKAMQELEKGQKGQILVLVTLQ